MADGTPFTAITALLNPVTPTQDMVMIWSTNPSNSTLALEQRKFGGKVDDAIGNGDDPARSPKIKKNSNLVSFLYDEAPCVYGVTDADDKICMLSPVFWPLKGAVSAYGRIAACLDGQGSSFMYWQKKTSSAVTLTEQQISVKTPGSRTITVNNIVDGSNLCALFDSTNRWIIYQEKAQGRNTPISLYSPTAKTSATIDDSGSKARQGTALAACSIPPNAVTKAPGMICVYMVDDNGQLYRAYSITGKNLSFQGKDNQPAKVGDAIVDVSSQIAVVLDPKNDKNIVYVVKENSDQVSSIDDPWPTPAPE